MTTAPSQLPAFVVCVERGRLEAQTLLLVESLRRWTGPVARASVVAVSPRRDHRPTPATLAALRALDVDVVTDVMARLHSLCDVGTPFPDYPVGNKVVACAWVAKQYRRAPQVLVFVDSDTVFLDTPRELLAHGRPVGVRPVDNRGPGSIGAGDTNEAHWLEAARICGRKRPVARVVTTVDQCDILAYYNAGLIRFDAADSFAEEWHAATWALVDAGFTASGNARCIDQIALALVLDGRCDLLPPSYNYPLPKRIRLAEPLRGMPLQNLVHVHYHRWFHRPGFLDQLHPPLDACERRAWLAARLPLSPVIDDPYPAWMQP